MRFAVAVAIEENLGIATNAKPVPESVAVFVRGFLSNAAAFGIRTVRRFRDGKWMARMRVHAATSTSGQVPMEDKISSRQGRTISPLLANTRRNFDAFSPK
jgi:hypothetical protein